MSGKYYPNNWQEISDLDPKQFSQIDYDEFMEMADLWHIPSSHCCIMRVENKETGKIKEYSYQRLNAAKRKLVKLALEGDNEILIVDDTAMALFKKTIDPQFPELFDDPLS